MNRVLLAGTLALACMLCAPAHAQTSSARPIRIIVPYTAGSSADIRGRIVAQALAAQLAQPVVIDNRPGIAGADILAKATPDGLTTGFLNATVLATATLLSATLPYDPDRDYTAVALIANSPEVLVTDARLNLNSVAELIAHAKTHPGKLNFGSAGATSLTRLAMELFKGEAGINLVHVPYKGINLAINDTIGGRVQTLISDLSGVQPFVRSGALKALAVTSARRIPLLPGVPTMGEAGLPNVISDNLTGLVAPAATPAPSLRRLHDAVVAALNKPEVTLQLTNQGVIPTPASADEFRRRVREERARWTPIIKAHGIRADG
jgi:tripartite-type tricarboxylate transporter receptor subunit TctC